MAIGSIFPFEENAVNAVIAKVMSVSVQFSARRCGSWTKMENKERLQWTS